MLDHARIIYVEAMQTKELASKHKVNAEYWGIVLAALLDEEGSHVHHKWWFKRQKRKFIKLQQRNARRSLYLTSRYQSLLERYYAIKEQGNAGGKRI